MIRRYAIVPAVACLLSCVPAGADQPDEVDKALEDMGGIRCISTRRILRTEILDEQNILFYLRGRETYRNELPRPCRELLRERRFSYRSHMGRLCDTDFITVLMDYGGSLEEGTSCGLGNFQPVSEDEIAALKGEQDVEAAPLPPAEPEVPEATPPKPDGGD